MKKKIFLFFQNSFELSELFFLHEKIGW